MKRETMILQLRKDCQFLDSLKRFDAQLNGVRPVSGGSDLNERSRGDREVAHSTTLEKRRGLPLRLDEVFPDCETAAVVSVKRKAPSE